MTGINMGLPAAVPGIAAPLADRDGEYTLIGGCCGEEKGRLYPRPIYCPDTLDPTKETAVGGRGEVYSYAVVRTKAPFGLPEPYAVGYVDLEDSGLRVFGLLDPDHLGRLSIGLKVKLVMRPLGVDAQGRACLRPVFVAQEANHV